MRPNPVTQSFSSGELSTLLLGRTESGKYTSGCETMENFTALAHGPAERRGGTQYIGEVKNSAHTTILINFEFSIDQTYVLEMGDQYMRFYANQVQVQVSNAAYEIATPYAHTEVEQIQFAQNEDVIWLTHPNHMPQKLIRLAHDSWTMADESFKKGPFLPVNQDESITLSFADTTSLTQNLTANTALFHASHVGTDWLVDTNPGNAAGEVVWVRVNSFTSTTVVNVTIKDESYLPTTTSPTNLWQEGAFSTLRGFPVCVIFYEQRLWYANTLHKPQTFWGSKIDNFDDFELGANADDSVSYSIASDRVNDIKWLAAQRVLMAGTAGGVYRITGGGDSAITPSNIDVKRQSIYGSKLGNPAYVGSEVFFIERSGKQVRNIQYKWQSDSFQSDDMTFLAEHITESGLLSLSYSHVPDSLIMGIRNDGVLVALTYNQTQEVIGWSRHITDGKFKSLAVISETGPDQHWFIVERIVNGVTKQYVELATPDTYLDCSKSYTGVAITTLTGLSHLEGKTVQVVTAEGVHPERVVSGGQITLDYPSTDIKVGLKYTSTLIPTRPAFNAGPGTVLGKKKRWSEVMVKLQESAIPTINGEQPPVRSVSTNYNEQEPLISADIQIVNLGYDDYGRITIKQDLPLPCLILSIFGILQVGT